MTFDSEHQKQVIMSALNNAPIQTSGEQLEQVYEFMLQLKEAVKVGRVVKPKS